MGIIQFQKITLQDKELFDKYFQQKRYENAHFNFTNLFIWRKVYQIQWAEADDYLFLKATWEGKTFFLPPFGAEAGFAEAVSVLEDYAAKNHLPFSLRGVEIDMVECLEKAKPGYFYCVTDRDNFDYVYYAEDLINLSGRKYHSKKNHANSFRKNFSQYQYQKMTAASALDCIDFTLEWCKQRNCQKGDDLDCEKDAIIEALTNFTALGFVGGIIYVDSKIKAFSFGELISSDTAVVHVEKGDNDMRGIYPVINQEFCRYNWGDITYVNREEDMGIEGLRTAKESYHPVKMIEKYVVTVK